MDMYFVGALIYIFVLVGCIIVVAHIIIFGSGVVIETNIETHTITNIDLYDDDFYNYILTLDNGESVLQTDYFEKIDANGIIDNVTECRMKLQQNLFWEYRVVEDIMVI